MVFFDQQVSVHAAFCLVVGVLSLHLINIFFVKEAKARKLQWAKCQSNFQGSSKFRDFQSEFSQGT